ncbi:DUF6443 domain-containing protein [Flavobacterium sp.]|uniref:DUF6443 domain-containing protein n=1 Tax=Flavobacterium sp. TaxID=239 RepID=UPI00260C4DE9|nr:DUF6443 domain-containing protein [Flavobacterium sp.]
MKNIFIVIITLLSFNAYSQSEFLNYTLKKSYKLPYTGNFAGEIDADGNLISGPVVIPDSSFVSEITYLDGLGRNFQHIVKGQSSNGKDIVTYFAYDYANRQNKKFLPYVRNSNSLSSETHPDDFVLSFYNTNSLILTGNPNFETTTNPYTEVEFDNSPMDRVLKQAAPGNDWAMANNHVIRFDYQTNKTADAVKLFTLNLTWNVSKGLYDIPTSLTPASYSEFQLYKTVTKDENWKTTDGSNNTTEEFTDKQGRVVLKRTYNNGIKHDTYYVYDQFGNLTFVLPPLVNATATITTAVLDGLCYQYKYDNRNRLVEKKLPGKQWEFIVYDKLDRVVATGPALSPFTSPTGNGWMITKYDAFNRVVYSGWMPTTFTNTSRSTLQTQYTSATTNFNETKIATTTNTTVNGIAFRYTNVALPTTGYHVLTVNYYDDYNFPNAPTIPTTVEGQTVFYNATLKPKGLPTGTYVRVPETSALYKNETSYILYDEKARPIRNYTTNYLGGFTQVDSKLDWAGKTLYTLTTHKRIASSAVTTVKDAFEYTLQDRLLKHTHQINGGTIQLLAKNEYDELGQLIVKRVGGTDLSGVNRLQRVNYSYNVRGWLTYINEDVVQSDYSEYDDLFYFKINYNTVDNDISGAINPLYNGNIAETTWISTTDFMFRRYGYQYDNLNRLTNAIYQKPDSAVPETNSYNESLTYDKNGNIISLQRNGECDDPVEVIQTDNLVYTYDSNNPNQLIKVVDSTNNPKGFSDGATVPTDVDFQYDANGNMIRDKNKDINISYNHLNLPLKITFASLNYIEYLYNAVGQKVKKVVKNGAVTTTTDYLSGYQYVNNVLEFFPTAEGYVKNTVISGVNNYNYIYNYTDHLGNIRLSYTFDTATSLLKIVEENNYYPFGLKHKNYNQDIRTYQGIESGEIRVRPADRLSFQYKYNGKEYQDELGLNFYDYGARNYDPAIGRWMNIDPLAEKDRRWTPYRYCYDNPLKFKDPDGMLEEWVDENGNAKVDKNGNYTEFATAQDKKFGDALRNSGDTGASLFNYLVSEDTHDIEINFTPTDSTEGGFYYFGQTENKDKDGGKTGKIVKSVIQIYMGTAETFVSDVMNNTIIPGTNDTPQDKKDIKTIKDNNLSATDVIAATIGHELRHTTDENQQLMNRENANPSTYNQNNNSETIPEKTKSQILIDISQQ